MLYLSIPYNQKLMEAVRKVPGARWEPKIKLWVVADSPKVRATICEQGLENRLSDQEVRAASVQARRQDKQAMKAVVTPAESSPRHKRQASRDKTMIRMNASIALEEILMREGAAYATRKSYCSELWMLASWYDGDHDRIIW
jgi:hypothetical protein